MIAIGSPVVADSCWDHNGSLMRLVANGNQREFHYEIPKKGLRKAGVNRGTLLFSGSKEGDNYIGKARRFSKDCPDTPLEYEVEGPVSRDQLHVTLYGSRQVYDNCQPSGRFVNDTLTFTYKHACDQ